jgi:hypothetical protein
MRQAVTLGYYVTDEIGTRRPKREVVFVDAEDGDGAASQALAQHTTRLLRAGGIGTDDAPPKVQVLGVDIAPPEEPTEPQDDAETEPVPSEPGGDHPPLAASPARGRATLSLKGVNP